MGLVNLYKASPKQSHQNRFFLCFFHYLFNKRNPIYKLSTAVLAERNKTKLSLFLRAYSEIVVPFPFNTITARQLEGLLRAVFLEAFYYAFEAWIHSASEAISLGISSFTKNTCATLRAQSNQLELPRSGCGFSTLVLQKSRVRESNFRWGSIEISSIGFDLLCRAMPGGIVNRTFENRTQSNSIELNPWIGFDWVRQSNQIEHQTLCEFDFRANRTSSNKSSPIDGSVHLIVLD